MSDASVRTARTADVAAVGEVQAAVWREAYADVLAPEIIAAFEPHAFAAAWEQSLRTPPSSWHRLMVATEVNQVVGFAAFAPTDESGVAEILAMGVHPEHQRLGHGSRLLNATVDTLRVGDFTQVELWLLVSDELSRAFLEKAGLHPDGAWRDRVIDEHGGTAREVRLQAQISDPQEPDAVQPL
ncbi:GNAT family N-acetyltransferase [Leekyejoonella antrihumi]|nr:GNAT family N-acetyltransferase [Leekyejoonella antrihumi]